MRLIFDQCFLCKRKLASIFEGQQYSSNEIPSKSYCVCNSCMLNAIREKIDTQLVIESKGIES